MDSASNFSSNPKLLTWDTATYRDVAWIALNRQSLQGLLTVASGYRTSVKVLELAEALHGASEAAVRMV